MKVPGDFDFGQMMQQAKQMQEDMQREMREIQVDASAGGGVVKVKMNGSKELLDLKIDPEAASDVEMLQDLIVASVNEASRKVDEAIKGKLGAKFGGLGSGLLDGLT